MDKQTTTTEWAAQSQILRVHKATILEKVTDIKSMARHAYPGSEKMILEEIVERCSIILREYE